MASRKRSRFNAAVLNMATALDNTTRELSWPAPPSALAAKQLLQMTLTTLQTVIPVRDLDPGMLNPPDASQMRRFLERLGEGPATAS